jgi:hypothetical protein
MNVIHILNVADWALIGAGLAATILMIIIGADGDPRPARKAPREGRRRRRPQ